MRQLLTPPIFADEKQTHIARLLYILLPALLLLSVVYTLVSVRQSPINAGRFWAQGISGVVVTSGLWYLARQGRVRIASGLLAAALWGLFTASAVTGAGVQGVAYTGYFVVVVAASVLLGGRAGAITTVVCALSGLGMVYAEARGILPPSAVNNSPLEIWFNTVMYFAAVAVLQYLAARTIREALARARASEAQYRMLFEEAPYGVVITDGQNQIQIVNPQACQILGYTPEETIGRVTTEFIAPEDLIRQPAASPADLRARPGFQWERPLVRKDGARVPVSISSQYMPDGRFQYILQDITERKRAEAALRESEELYRRAIEAAGAVPYYHDYSVETYPFMGEGIRTISGYGPDEMTPPLWESLVEETVLVGECAKYPYEEAIARARAGQLPVWTCDYRIRASNGERRWIFDAAAEVLNAQGVSAGSIGILQDITERKRAEEALRRYAARLEILHEMDRALRTAQSPQATATAAAEHLRRLIPCYRLSIPQFDFQNNRLFVLAASSEGPAYFPAGSVVSFDDYGWRTTEAMHRGETYMVEDVLRAPEASALDLRHASEGIRCWLCVPLINQGELIGAINLGATTPNAFTSEEAEIVRDVANQLAIAIQQSRLFEEIQKMNVELEQRVARRTGELKAANKELEAFTYSVSHDLRAPLRAVDGFSRLLQENHAQQLAPEPLHYLSRVREGAQHMGHLIDDLLAFSRLGRQALRLQPLSPADLRAMARHVLDDLRTEAKEERQIETVIHDLPPCQADPSLLRQVFVNLLSNAIKYTRPREITRIEIGSQPAPEGPAYFVRDNGVGFDMRYAHKLFGVFQRLHRAEDFEGTGVGLAIVQRIIHRHGGRIWAEAAVEHGATFYFTLGNPPPG